MVKEMTESTEKEAFDAQWKRVQYDYPFIAGQDHAYSLARMWWIEGYIFRMKEESESDNRERNV